MADMEIPKNHDDDVGTEDIKYPDDLLLQCYDPKADKYYFSPLSTITTTQEGQKRKDGTLNSPLPNNGRHIPFVHSCNGLLCIDDMDGNIALWNPSTSDFKLLPPSSVERPKDAAALNFYCSGFGFDSTSQDYKVVRFILFTFEDEDGSYIHSDEHVEVYSLKSHSWKEIPGPDLFLFHSSSTYVNGIYYWKAIGDPFPTWWGGYVSFDFSKEEFSSFSMPPLDGNYCSYLLEFDGSLSLIPYFASTIEKSLQLWVRKDGSWTKNQDFAIHVSGVRRPLAFCRKNNVLFFKGPNRGELLVFDIDSKTLKNLGIQEHLPTSLQLIPYVKTSIRLNDQTREAT